MRFTLRFYILVFTMFLLGSHAQAEQRIEHQGREILTFDIPELTLLRQREGRLTRAYFSRAFEDGKLKLTVTSQSWVHESAAERSFKTDQQAQRKSPHSRLLSSPKISGLTKVLAYKSSWPFESRVLILYHKDFRCKLLVSGAGLDEEVLESIFEELSESLKVLPRFRVDTSSLEPQDE